MLYIETLIFDLSGGSNETYCAHRWRHCRTCYTKYCYDSETERTRLQDFLHRFLPGYGKKLIEEMGIPYYGISSGKLRRYFDIKNFTDPFRVLKGFHEAKKLMKQLKPDVVFLRVVSYRSCCYCCRTSKNPYFYP